MDFSRRAAVRWSFIAFAGCIGSLLQLKTGIARFFKRYYFAKGISRSSFVCPNVSTSKNMRIVFTKSSKTLIHGAAGREATKGD